MNSLLDCCRKPTLKCLTISETFETICWGRGSLGHWKQHTRNIGACCRAGARLCLFLSHVSVSVYVCVYHVYVCLCTMTVCPPVYHFCVCTCVCLLVSEPVYYVSSCVLVYNVSLCLSLSIMFLCEHMCITPQCMYMCIMFQCMYKI